MNGLRIALFSALAGTVLVGCASRPEYQDSSLQDVVAHRNPAPLERYQIDRPPIAAVRRNTAIIRQGTLFAILVGPDLKQTLDRYPADVRFGVRFARDPRPHLVLERVFTGQEFVDVLAGKESFRFHFPKLVESSEVPFDRFPPDPPAEWLIRGGDAQLSEAPLVLALPEEKAAAWAAARVPGFRTDRETYFLGPPDARILVGSRDPLTLLMLDFLRFEKRPFSGGVSLVAAVPPPERAGLGIAGVADVRWIQLSSLMYFVAQ